MSPCPAEIGRCPCSLERFCIPVLGCNLASLTTFSIPVALVMLSDAQSQLVAVPCLAGPAEPTRYGDSGGRRTLRLNCRGI